MASIAADQVSYDDLYARWERGNWQATEIDFSVDRRQWTESFSDLERRAALWNYSLFFWGEDAVADNLSPFIDAAPREEQKYFLATQQVDEARHAIFFKRFMREVCDVGDGTVAGGLDAIRPQLTWGFVKTFELLDKHTAELRRDRSRTKLAQAVTLYHVVVEALLAQPGQHCITDYLTERDLLPGFRGGMHNVALDEQRHIGFGVKLLRDLAREDPDVPAAVGATCCARCCRTRSPSSCRPAGTAATPSASASRSRRSTRMRRARSRASCAPPGSRSRRSRCRSRSRTTCRRPSARGAGSRCSRAG